MYIILYCQYIVTVLNINTFVTEVYKNFFKEMLKSQMHEL